MNWGVLLSLVAALYAASCSSVVPDKQLLGEEKMDAVTASGENQKEATLPDLAAEQRSRINQNLVSPSPAQDKTIQPLTLPGAAFPLIPSVLQSNVINQGR